jgi:hypothetical protein
VRRQESDDAEKGDHEDEKRRSRNSRIKAHMTQYCGLYATRFASEMSQNRSGFQNYMNAV